MEEYLKEVQADPNVQIMVDSLLKKNPLLSLPEAIAESVNDSLATIGYKNDAEHVRDTCNIISNKKFYINKYYDIIGERNPFNIIKIKKIRAPTEESKTIAGVGGQPIHYLVLGPFNLFDRVQVEQLSIFISEKNKSPLIKILDKLNWEEKTSHLTTVDIFKLLDMLEINHAYIVDTSCSSLDGSEMYEMILPEDVGYGGGKRKSRKRKRKTKKNCKSRKRKIKY